MTLFDLIPALKPGDWFKRDNSIRMFRIGNSKNPQLICNHAEQSASFFTDDLCASDWNRVPDFGIIPG